MAAPDLSLPPSAGHRILALDLLRGLAVLGIVAVNVAGFAGPIAATDTPALAYGRLPPASGAEEAAFALIFLIFEGKMRALFSMLFGASMLLFMERAQARGRDGGLLQMRRLGWLALFGYLHYLLLWWGDILFVYALAGLLVLPLRHLPARAQLAMALAIFLLWHGSQTLLNLPLDLAEEHVRLGIAGAAEQAQVTAGLADIQARMAQDLARDGAPFFAAIATRLTQAPFWPLDMAAYTLGETVPLMLIGMALYRSGFFSNTWPRGRMQALAAGGLVLGGGWALALLLWMWPRHFPPIAMPDLLSYWAGPEHLALALAYAALIMLTAPALLASRLGQRLAAAGRMAFSNYLGTSIVMSFLFHGWGLGLEGHVPRIATLGFVALVWCLMLAWSTPWLTRFRQGPLEWLWRSLTEWRIMPMRRV